MLRSGSPLKGCAIVANDGEIGTVFDLLFDDNTWKVRWLVVDIGSWLTGRKVLDYQQQTIAVSLTKAQVRDATNILADQHQVKASPVWDRLQYLDPPYQERLHRHHGWPGDGLSQSGDTP